MTSDAITRLNAALEGRYRIERQLGEGGMATVYLAADLRHERKVALKVLKPELAAVVGAERFLAEIKTTANLQHPHILPLFDSGEAGSFLFYVMPYVEGESLRQKLDREHQLPVEEAVRIATNVAEALDYAHSHGVIHRDIKPANILLQAGKPVVSDFGIALAIGAAGGGRLTETGLSLGTPHYMSPEQATGDVSVGAAADIYALGCVLYEMLVGEPPYTGTTAQAILGKIIQAEAVSATKARRSVPANVDAAIRKSLEKLSADRFSGALDFAKALAEAGFRHGYGGPVGVSAGHGQWTPLAVAMAALALVFGVGFGWTLLRSGSPEPPRRIERFAVPFLEGQVPEFRGNAGFDLSPDGSMLVYRHNVGDQQILMVRRWDDLSATPIRETTGSARPAVSFDGLEVAFQQDGMIRVAAFAGGPVRTLIAGSWPEWGPDGYVYATTDSGAVRIPSTGGAVEYVSRLAEGEAQHVVYDVLPAGRHALLWVTLGGGQPDEIRGLDLRSGEMTPIIAGSYPRYVPSGHLVYDNGAGTLMAARFDPKRLELRGTPIPVADGILAWSLSDDGKLFYTQGTAGGTGQVQLVWVTRTGELTPVDPAWTFAAGADDDNGWSISPDGSMVALREFTADGYDIWVKRLDTGPRSRLTFGDAQEKMPTWSSDGRSVTFLSDRGGGFDAWSVPADGTGSAESILDLDQDVGTIVWSPDGDWLVARTSLGAGDSPLGDILALRPGADTEPTPLLTAEYTEMDPAVSPDGRWLAYASDETGRYEIYVRPFPNVGAGRVQVSIDGGRNPHWAHSGRELFFEGSPVRAFMAASVEVGTSFDLVVGTPTLLFQGNPVLWGSDRTGMIYDVAPDDQRFLMASSRVLTGAGSDDEAPPMVLVENFFEELNRLAPN